MLQGRTREAKAHLRNILIDFKGKRLENLQNLNILIDFKGKRFGKRNFKNHLTIRRILN